VLGPAGSAIGSNSWAISGARTNTGHPLLANDPHLGIQMPSIWFQVNLHCAPQTAACPFEVGGFSFAGVPGIVIGHNDRLAWGFTNTGPDVMDLFILKINPANPNQYEYNGQWLNFETRTETILIAGSDPQELLVRVSRFGPVISETYGPLKDNPDPESAATPFKDQAGIELPENYAMALRWTALEPGSVFEAIWGFNKAQNWQEFRAATQNFVVPAQNLIYADIEGNIGYQMPGNIPIRNSGDGRLPVPGWSDEYEWSGYIPFEELPFVLNPPSGYIATANNQVPPNDYPYLVSTDWDYGFRAARIVEMIEKAPAKIDSAYIQTMHGDSKSLNAESLIPVLLQVNLPTDLAAPRDQYLANWDYQETIDSAPAALFEAFYWNLLVATFYDEAIPENYLPSGGSRYYEVLRVLINQPNSAWWDDKSTPNQVETRDDIFALAFAEAVKCNICTQKFGADISQWKWGELHTSTFRNGTLGQSGIAPIENLFNRGPFPTGGGESIVNATGWSVGQSFETDWLPSMRMIVDLGDLNQSLSVHTTGESGHAYHPHYIDMADLWRNIEYYPMLWEQSAILESAESHLRLRP
jgi:penicillin amidase